MLVPPKETPLRNPLPIALTSGYLLTKTCFRYSFAIDKLILTLKPSVSENPNPLNCYISALPQREQFFQASEEITLVPDIITVEKCYNYFYKVYFRGDLVAELATGLRIKAIDRDFTRLKFYNPMFYMEQEEGKPPTWYTAYISLLKALPLQLNNVKALELALDANRNFVREFGSRYNYSTANPDCKPDHLEYEPCIKETKVTPYDCSKSFYIGDKSRKQIAIYDKTEDIIVKHKQYIFQYWERYGVEAEGAERIEVKMTEKYLGKLEFGIEDLIDQNFLLTLFKKGVGNNLSFKDLASRYYDKNRNYKMEVIHLLQLDQLTIPEPIEIHQKRPATRTTTKEHRKVRQTIKTLVETFILTGNTFYYQAIQHLGTEAKIPNLQELVNRYASGYEPETLTEETFQRVEKLQQLDCVEESTRVTIPTII